MTANAADPRGVHTAGTPCARGTSPERHAEPQLIEIPLEKIRDHPRNPQVIFRNDVVQAIAAHLKGGSFPKEHAIRVRPIGDWFELVGGHHRVRGAA